MLKDKKLFWLILAAILVTIFEFFSLAGMRFKGDLSAAVFGLIILIIGYETIWHGLKALFKMNFHDINLLMIVAVAGAFYIQQYVEAAVVIVLFSLAERLEGYGIAKSKSSLDALVEKMPKYAYLKGEDRPLDVESIKVGDIIIVKPHHLIPLDGEVVFGQSFVDESTITGEPIPRDKLLGDKVFAGTLNKQGVLEVRVVKSFRYTTLAKIRELTFDAVKTKAKTQKFIEEFSLYYTPAILALALLWIFISLLGEKPFALGFTQALSLLVISCPCALVISTPISIYSAIGNASSEGVLIKGGRFLEAIGQLKAIAFDKTRTLTYGEPIVTDIIPFGKITREEFLSCVAGVEFFSEHPLAKSVVMAAKKEKLSLHRVENFESIVGKGAKAECLVCDDSHHCVGKLDFILEEHHVSEEAKKVVEKLQGEGKTVIVVSTQKELEGVIALEDEVRQEGFFVVSALKKLGITSVLLTGDHEKVAKAVAKRVGIDTVKAELLPEGKAEEIKNLAEKHKIVAMIGDGVNDAPALACANVGISMTSLGSDIALDAAAIVILNNHLKMLPYLVKLGRKTLAMIRFNTSFAVAVKCIVVVLALLDLSNIALAIFADVGVTLFVVLNSLRLLGFKPREKN